MLTYGILPYIIFILINKGEKMNIRPELILKYMMDNELSLNAFSTISKIHRDTLMSIMNGGNVQIKTVLKLARVLNIDLLEFFKKD